MKDGTTRRDFLKGAAGAVAFFSVVPMLPARAGKTTIRVCGEDITVEPNSVEYSEGYGTQTVWRVEPAYVSIPVTNEMLNDSAFDIETWVRDDMRDAFKELDRLYRVRGTRRLKITEYEDWNLKHDLKTFHFRREGIRR